MREEQERIERMKIQNEERKKQSQTIILERRIEKFEKNVKEREDLNGFLKSNY